MQYQIVLNFSRHQLCVFFCFFISLIYVLVAYCIFVLNFILGICILAAQGVRHFLNEICNGVYSNSIDLVVVLEDA